MKCMAVRSYLEVLEFPHWEWGGIHADLFFFVGRKHVDLILEDVNFFLEQL